MGGGAFNAGGFYPIQRGVNFGVSLVLKFKHTEGGKEGGSVCRVPKFIDRAQFISRRKFMCVCLQLVLPTNSLRKSPVRGKR